jgi:hypothetical protein
MLAVSGNPNAGPCNLVLPCKFLGLYDEPSLAPYSKHVATDKAIFVTTLNLSGRFERRTLCSGTTLPVRLAYPLLR